MKHWKRNTAAFLLGQAVSILGSTLVQYAITWHITLTTKSGVLLMLSMLVGFVPLFLLSPFAGVWADRYDRKKLIIIADAGIAIATLILAFLFMGGVQEIWLLLIVMAVRAFGSAVQMPCVNAILPDIVPDEQLTRMNGLSGSVQSLITLISPMLAGALMAFAPLHIIFFIDVATAAVAVIIMFALVRVPHTPKEKKKNAYFKEMKEGFQYIWKTPFIKITMLVCTGLWFCLGVIFLMGLQVARNYGGEVWQLSVVEIAFAGGMLAGGILISVWGGIKNKVLMIGAGFLFLGASTVALGFKMPFAAYASIMAFIGILLPVFNTPAITLLQQNGDPKYIGRVFSIFTMLNTGLQPLGSAIFGPLADVIPIEYLLFVSGGGIVLTAIIFLSFKKKLDADIIRTGELRAMEAAAEAEKAQQELAAETS